MLNEFGQEITRAAVAVTLKTSRALAALFVVVALAASAAARADAQPLRVAVLDFGEAGRTAADHLFLALSSNKELLMVDREEGRAAARGTGYAGSLNMSLQEARDLGGAVGCDFYLTGDAQTLRRSSTARTSYHEAYASVFIVSARTGRLVMWDRPSVEASSPAEASKGLLDELAVRAPRYASAIFAAREAERAERARKLEGAAPDEPVIEDAPEDEAAARREGLRLPQPYRRLRPAYPESAALAEAEATVDVQAEITVEGKVSRVEVVRWAGFGLDEAAVNTVRQINFTPARRDGAPVPMRVLLRYNFRRPPKEVNK